MEISLSTLRALLLSAAHVDRRKFQEAEADQDRETGKERVWGVPESENVRGKKTGGKKTENRGGENDKGVGEGNDEGGEEEQGEEACLDVEGPHQAVNHVNQGLPQLPEQREALNDNGEGHGNPWHPKMGTMSCHHGQGETEKPSDGKTKAE